MPLSIVRNNIAQVKADVLVNAANTRLAAGGGVCGAIFAGAGYAQMEAACASIGHCDTGDAVVTPAFNLPAKYVVHAVGPVWRGGNAGERGLLASAYAAVFSRAAELGAESVALPLISAGIFGYPPAESLELATTAAQGFLDVHPDARVAIVVFDRAAFAASLGRFRDVASYIDDVYVDACRRDRRADLRASGVSEDAAWDVGEVCEAAPAPRARAAEAPAAAAAPTAARPRKQTLRKRLGAFFGVGVEDGLSNRLEHLDASFSQTVLALIDERGLTDAETYKRANLSRQLFSKLRKDEGYRPTKQTAVALAMALELSLDDTNELLARAGYILGHASKFDVIVEYYIDRGCYDVMELNEALFAFDQPLVGSM